MATENLEYLDESGMNRTAVNVLAKIAEAKAQIEAELDSLDYAQPDGIYPDMTVGAVIGADETAQWATRESTGTGSATVRSVQGAAVAWEQQIRLTQTTTTLNGVTFVRNPDGTVTANGTATADALITHTSTFNVISGHKYLVKGCPAGGSTSTYMAYITGGGFPFAGYQDTGEGAILSPSAGGISTYVLAFVKSGFTAENLVFRPMLYDLTAMFGSGNEPQSVAEFEAMYPLPYYPYSIPTLKPVQIAGIQSTDANGDALDSVEWSTQTLRAAGSVRDELTADELVTRVGVVDLGTLTWSRASTNTSGKYRFNADLDVQAVSSGNIVGNVKCAAYASISNDAAYSMTNGVAVRTVGGISIYDSAYDAGLASDFKTAMSGILLYYELATPTTTPISPALPMTYRVQQGGAESIIGPEGEISAAPILTIADPVNMSTELALIWAAIEALQANRQTLQSSVRTDVQEITSELTPIDVTKEVQQIDESKEVSE